MIWLAPASSSSCCPPLPYVTPHVMHPPFFPIIMSNEVSPTTIASCALKWSCSSVLTTMSGSGLAFSTSPLQTVYDIYLMISISSRKFSSDSLPLDVAIVMTIPIEYSLSIVSFTFGNILTAPFMLFFSNNFL